MAKPTIIPRETFKISSTRSTSELHISGGLRALEQAPRLWSLGPLLSKGKQVALKPMAIQQIDQAAKDAGQYLFGGDQVSGLGTPLVSRMWTPLNGPTTEGLQTSDLWAGIAGNASDAGNETYAMLARNIAYSLRAAGIRLRDASDGFHNQLIAALQERAVDGRRFTNVAATDIHLAFHSVLSELASARDYLAATLANRFGAPLKVDAMNRLAEWLGKSANTDLRSCKVVAAALAAYDSSAADPWLYELTEYRNQFLHRSPFGTARNSHLLQLSIKAVGELQSPALHMPLGEDDRWAPGEDALKRFITLYRRMIDLLSLAADNAPYDSTPPHFVVSDA